MHSISAILKPLSFPGDFIFRHHVIIVFAIRYVSKPLHKDKRILSPFLTPLCLFYRKSQILLLLFYLFLRWRALLSGRDLLRVRHDAMGIQRWRAGSSLPSRYRDGPVAVARGERGG
jgi:hypothetical protein